MIRHTMTYMLHPSVVKFTCYFLSTYNIYTFRISKQHTLLTSVNTLNIQYKKVLKRKNNPNKHTQLLAGLHFSKWSYYNTRTNNRFQFSYKLSIHSVLIAQIQWKLGINSIRDQRKLKGQKKIPVVKQKSKPALSTSLALRASKQAGPR